MLGVYENVNDIYHVVKHYKKKIKYMIEQEAI